MQNTQHFPDVNVFIGYYVADNIARIQQKIMPRRLCNRNGENLRYQVTLGSKGIPNEHKTSVKY